MNKGNNRILVVGDIMLDHYLHGNCSRISSEAPVPIIEFQTELWFLGGAANVANNLISLGSEVILCGCVGDDRSAQKLKELLLDKKILDQTVISSDRKTTVKSRVVANNHQLIRIDHEVKVPLSEMEENIILDKIRNISSDCNCIVLSDYNKGVITHSLIQKIVLLARASGIKILVDPKTPPFTKYKGVTVIKPNKKEASIATGIEISDRNSLELACKLIREQTECETVIITLSEQGVAYYEGDEVKIIPTRAQEVFDVTGAGDTFLAGLAYSFVNEKSVHDACEFANYASALVIAKQGCATVSIEEINWMLLSTPET